MSAKSARAPSSSHETKPVVTFTKADSYRLYVTLGQLKSVVADPKYLYALVRLRKSLQPEAETIEELNKIPDRIQELETKRQQLCQSFASKDASGNALISPDKNYVIPADQKIEFESSIKRLQDEFRKDLDLHQQTIQRINEIAKELSEIQQLPSIPVSALSGGLNMDQMEALFPLLAED